MTDLLMVQARAAVVSSPVIRLQAGHMVALPAKDPQCSCQIFSTVMMHGSSCWGISAAPCEAWKWQSD